RPQSRDTPYNERPDPMSTPSRSADMMPPESPRLVELRKRLEKDPGSRLFLELARGLHEDGRFADAAAACEHGLRAHPSYLSARVLLGRIYFDMGRTDEARETMETVLSVAPDNLIARRVLADICLESGDNAGALERLRALLAFTPGDAEIARRIEEIEAGGSPPAAPATAPQTFSAASTSSTVPVPAAAAEPDGARHAALATPTLAEIYVQQGLPEQAAEVYREILQGDPAHDEARTRLGEIEAALRQRPDPEAAGRRRRIEALQGWLRTIRSARPAGPDAGPRHGEPGAGA
ncbi:MAG TPA: tetratricopeptide repeat protein, partial [Candidatus Polarisedimenticolia bacterium]|nr:tetratricopeptide repeat protein [Candidatus Polarisedimenticolia bacterium]